jgi:hypothetical protein
MNFENRERSCIGPSLLMLAVVVATCVLVTGCKPAQKASAKAATVPWSRVGSWSGHGNAQTESFDIGYTQVRVRWETRNEKSPGAGTLVVTVNSAVSGRELAVAVDHRGTGGDTAYVSVDPHWSYLVIESSNVDWSVTVEEPALVDGHPAGS